MKRLNAIEMRSIEAGATYYAKDVCPVCGTTITGKKSGWAIFAPILKAAAKKNMYANLQSHLRKKHGW